MIACHRHVLGATPEADCARCGGDLAQPISRAEITERLRRYREDAQENVDRPKPTTPGAQHARMLTDPRDERIIELVDALLAGVLPPP